ncbi:MAG: SLC13 family permease [Myxococcota bacterium]
MPEESNRKRSLFLVAGPLLGLTLAAAAGATFDLDFDALACVFVTALCATWWVTEAIPIPATSLIPFAAFPLLGVLDHTGVSTAYGHSLILLLLGGFMLSTAMEKSGAHHRVAMAMVRLVGGAGGPRLILGFMVASAVLSMWISNTATVLMLLPVALAVIDQANDDTLDRPLLLGIAYAASIGGIGTPVGTPPNVILMGVFTEKTGREIAFAEWMQFGLPIVFVFLPLAWLWLSRNVNRNAQPLELPPSTPWSAAEKRVLFIFFVTALAWVTRTAPFGGWAKAFGITGTGDATVALAAVVVMFLVPTGNDDGERLLDWKTASSIPWGLLLLFGGGLAIAKAFDRSGLSTTLGQTLSGLASWPLIPMVLLIALTVTFVTEVTSNTATTSLLMPILAPAAIAAGLDPLLMMAPAAISASCAFMLPVATAPNAIVFGTGKLTTRDMSSEGFILNLGGAFLITAACAILL